jgi:Domain of unknown function (DUF4157)
MFAPLIAKPQARTAGQSSVKSALRHAKTFGHDRDIEQPQTSRLAPQTLPRFPDNEPPSAAWGFSKIPLYPPRQTSGSEHPSPAPAPRLPGPIQRKLKVGAIDDPLEHEADRVANQVMRMPAPGAAMTSVSPQISGKCVACGEEERLQMEEGGPQAASGEAPASVHEVLRSPGQPLDPATRAYFEPRFGRDFSDVRVHTGAVAGQSARGVNANAYTVGHNVVFGARLFEPRTREGRRLIAHELTHVVQQAHGILMVQRTPVEPSNQIRTDIDGKDDVVSILKPDRTIEVNYGDKSTTISFQDKKGINAKLVRDLEISTAQAKQVLQEILEEWPLRKTLISYAQRKGGARTYLIAKLRNTDQKGYSELQSDAFEKPVGEEILYNARDPGVDTSSKLRLSQYAIVFEEIEPNQFKPQKSTATVQEWQYPGDGQRGGKALIRPIAVVRTESGVIVEIVDNVMQGTPAEARAELIKLFQELRWKVNLSKSGPAPSGGGGGALAPVEPPAQETHGPTPPPQRQLSSGPLAGSGLKVGDIVRGPPGDSRPHRIKAITPDGVVLEPIGPQAPPSRALPGASQPTGSTPKATAEALLTEKAIEQKVAQLSGDRARAVVGKIATVGGRAFALLKVGGYLYLIYSLTQIRNVTDAFQFGAGMAFNFVAVPLAAEAAGAGVLASPIAFFATMPSDQAGPSEEEIKKRMVYEFLLENFTREEVENNWMLLHVQANTLLFNTKPFEIVSNSDTISNAHEASNAPDEVMSFVHTEATAIRTHLISQGDKRAVMGEITDILATVEKTTDPAKALEAVRECIRFLDNDSYYPYHQLWSMQDRLLSLVWAAFLQGE